ncbi:MAG: nucleotide exchange factor GrpE [Hyphomicrobium sp.]
MSDDKKPAEPASSPAPDAGVNPFDDRPAAKSATAPEATETGEQTIDAEGGEADAQTPGELGIDQLKAVIGALQSELEKQAGLAAQKHDQFVRAAAETENVRRRLEKEKEDTAKYAISKFAMDILTVGDNFQRAIDAVPKEAVAADPALKTLLDGVLLAERDFQKVLDRHGVKTIDPAGQSFNPHHHQAVMEEENVEVPPGTILRVFQSGYLIDDRCLRPAMVVVSRGGPKPGKAPENGAPPPAGNDQG